MNPRNKLINPEILLGNKHKRSPEKHTNPHIKKTHTHTHQGKIFHKSKTNKLRKKATKYILNKHKEEVKY